MIGQSANYNCATVAYADSWYHSNINISHIQTKLFGSSILELLHIYHIIKLYINYTCKSNKQCHHVMFLKSSSVKVFICVKKVITVETLQIRNSY